MLFTWGPVVSLAFISFVLAEINWSEFYDDACSNVVIQAPLFSDQSCKAVPPALQLNFLSYQGDCNSTDIQLHLYNDNSCSQLNTTIEYGAGEGSTDCKGVDFATLPFLRLRCVSPSPSPSPSQSLPTRTSQVVFYCRVKDTSVSQFNSFSAQYIQTLFSLIHNPGDNTVIYSDISLPEVETYSLGTQVETAVQVVQADVDIIKTRIQGIFADGSFQRELQSTLSQPKEISLEGDIRVLAISNSGTGSTPDNVPASDKSSLDLVAVIFILLAIVLVFVSCIALVLYKLP